MRLYFCKTATANGPIIHAPDDTWVNIEQRWNDIDRRKPKDSEKILSQYHLPITNHIWTGLGANPGLRCERPATNRLCYSTTFTSALKIEAVCSSETLSTHKSTRRYNSKYQHRQLHSRENLTFRQLYYQYQFDINSGIDGIEVIHRR
jgi:hypothetical protein